MILQINKKKGAHTNTIDFAKAFDKIPTTTPPKQLDYYDIRDRSLKLTEAFICGRTECVVVEGSKSAIDNATFGVLKGSVLGRTLLFICMSGISDNIQNKCR